MSFGMESSDLIALFLEEAEEQLQRLDDGATAARRIGRGDAARALHLERLGPDLAT